MVSIVDNATSLLLWKRYFLGDVVKSRLNFFGIAILDYDVVLNSCNFESLFSPVQYLL